METTTSRNRVAGEVRASIARSGMKPFRIAQDAGIPQSTLSRRLSGKSAFSVDELIKIAAVLDVEVSTFFPSMRQRSAAA